jgi:hypothetical protein
MKDSVPPALASSIMHDPLKFQKVCSWWVPRELKNRGKINWMGLSLQHLLQDADGEYMLNRTVTRNESWVLHYQPKSKHASVQSQHPSSPFLRECCWPIFRSVAKMLILHYTVKFYWSFGMQLTGNIYANWQERSYFIMTMPAPIQPEQSGREFKIYSGNFLKNIRLTARTWPLLTSTVWSVKNTTLVANISLMTKRLEQRCRSGRDNSQNTSMLQVLMRW